MAVPQYRKEFKDILEKTFLLEEITEEEIKVVEGK